VHLTKHRTSISSGGPSD